MSVEPRVVVVDLTPVLPGGENGGAKIFVLELLRRLAERAPRSSFVLLTQAAAHEELAALDRPNMRRLMVIGAVQERSLRIRLRGVAERMLPHLPGRARRLLTRASYRVSAALKRRRTGTLLHELGADLLFCPFTAPTFHEPGIPTVCTIYDLQYKTYPEFFGELDAAHRDRTFVEASRHATALTAISDYSRSSAITHGGLDPERIRTICLRMAQRISPRAAHDPKVLAGYGLEAGRYLVYPANFWRHKNHEMLLAAFGMARRSGLAPDVKLVCTGAPGARRDWLASAAAAMGLGNHVVFPGFIPESELATVIGQSAGVVFPSLYEGFGLPVVEAMSAGVPVACSDTTSLPEVAADAAILFDPRIPERIAQAIVTLAGDEVLRARLVQAGLARAAEFSDSHRMVEEYWDLFLFAMTHERRDNQLAGAFPDGWIGPTLTVQVAPAPDATHVEVELLAPDWLTHARLQIHTVANGVEARRPLLLPRGSSTVWKAPVDTRGGRWVLRIGPSFVPAKVARGDDQRELSCMIRRCEVLHADGRRTPLMSTRSDA
jgi:glycosyltransferase involved in cell wall biosynthesis